MVNARNCVIDLSTGKIETKPHRPEDLCLHQLGTAYDPSSIPRTFLETITRPLPDAQLRQAYQVLMGQALIEKTFQHLVILTGAGANGKTTFGEAIQGVFGSYSKTIDPSTLAESQRSGAAPSPDIARVAGGRIVNINDPRKGQQLAQGIVKSLTGGDRITARFAYGEPFEFPFQGTVVVRTNHLPRFDGGDYAMARRVLVVPFDVVIPTAERDAELPDKLRLEASGILNWLLKECLDYVNNGLQLPTSVKTATRAYITAHDPVGRFIDEQLELDAHGRIANTELEEAWQKWYEDEEGKLDRAPRSVPRTVRALQNELIRRLHGVERYKSDRERGLSGISWRDLS